MIDWELSIKPLLCGNGAALKADEVVNISRTLIENKQKILHHDEMHGNFFSLFVALAGQALPTGFENIHKDDFELVAQACNVVLQYCIVHIVNYTTKTQPTAVTQNHLVLVVKSLCGDHVFQRSDIIKFIALIKSVNIPMLVKKSDLDQNSDASSTVIKEEASNTSKGVSNEDLFSVFAVSTTDIDPGKNLTIALKQRNLEVVQALSIEHGLVKSLLGLPCLKQYVAKHQAMVEAWKLNKVESVDFVNSEKVATSTTEELFQLQTDLRLVKDACDPFITEPFTQNELLINVDLVLGCLCAAVNVTMAVNILQQGGLESAINQECQIDASQIVKDALHVCKAMVSAMGKSAHFGANVCHNLQFLALNQLLHGMKSLYDKSALLPTTSDFFIGISSLASEIIRNLLVECNTNAWRYPPSSESQNIALFANVMNTVSPLQQLQYLASQFPVLQLLMGAVSMAFNAVHGAKLTTSIQIEDSVSSPTGNKPAIPGQEGFSYYDDDGDDEDSSDSQSDEDDDDDETMLGSWGRKFFDMGSPEETKSETPLLSKSELPTVETNKPSRSASSKTITMALSPDFLPESMQDQFLQLLSSIMKMVVDSIMLSKVEWLKNYFCQNLSDKILMDIADMVNEIDGDGKIISTEGIAIMSFVTKLLSTNLFDLEKRSRIAKIFLAKHLEKENQLFLGPLAASILAQHLIQQQEIGKGSSDSAEVISFINSLVHYYQNQDEKAKQDVGVEMFQLVLFLFHTLTSHGQETFLLKVATGVACLKPSTCEPLCTARLLLLFDYLLHGFSAPSSQLLHQVKWNFQAVCGVLSTDLKPKDRMMTTRECFDSSKLMFVFNDVYKPKEETKTKDKENKDIASLIFPILIAKPNQESAANKYGKNQPKLYELLQDVGSAFDEEKRLVNEKALNIILKDATFYDKLFGACVSCLEAGEKLQSAESDEWSNSLKYTFQVVWRLLKSLPPSESFLKMCENGEASSTSEFLMAFYHITTKLDSNTSATTPTAETNAVIGATPEKSIVMDGQLKQLIKLCEQFLASIVHLTSTHSSPSPLQMMVLRCILNQTQVQLWSKFLKSIDAADPYDAMPLVSELLTVVLQMVTAHATLCRNQILRLALKEEYSSWDESNKEALLAVMQCVDVDMKRTTEGCTNIPLPLSISEVLASWSQLRQQLVVYTNTNKDTLNNCLQSHFRALSCSSDNSATKTTTVSLLLVQDPLYLLCDDLVVWIKDCTSPFAAQVCDTLVPLLADVTCMDGYHQIKQALEKVTGGPSGSEENSDTLDFYSLRGAYNILTKYIDPATGIKNKTVAIKYLTYLEASLNDHSMQRALNKFFASDDANESASIKTDAETKTPVTTFKGKAGSGKGSIVELMLTNRMLTSAEYSNQLLQFIAKLCKYANGNDSHAQACLGPICKQMCDFNLTPAEMRDWVSKFDLNAVTDDGVSLRDDISSALLSLSQFVLSEHCPVDQKLALHLLDAILPIDTSPEVAVVSLQAMSPKFVSILATLADAENGKGHTKLLHYVLWWLDACALMLKDHENASQMHAQKENDITRAVSTCSAFLIYVGNVLSALKAKLTDTTEQPEEADSDMEDLLDASYEHECDFEEPDMDAGNEDESSQDEEGLWNKLCTYTITQKKFMNQHWYHCHTCEMVDGVGVCTVCAKVCHKGHDLTYAKFGSFFCDCGAKENKSCKALVKRVPGSDKLASGVSAFSDSSRPASASTSASNVVPVSTSTSATSQKTAEPTATTATDQATATAAATAAAKALGNSAKPPQRTPKYVTGKPLNVEASTADLLRLMENPGADVSDENLPQAKGVVATLLKVLGVMQSVIHTEDYKLNSASSTLRALKAMEDLHQLQKPTTSVDTLMVPTLGSQEGAFENVKANFTGEQGQTIRQLINARYIRRVAMCCLATTAGRRQHLAVSHEKTKVTLLQLSALLKQANVSKRKLTLTRLSTTAMPFSVTTITANPSNDEVLAVCGLKDCHVLTYASTPAVIVPSGSVTQHLVLHPQLATNNYIIRAVWLPASPSMLALVTADFIKIYDLSKDILSPCFYLLLPTGKIRDATFIGGMQSDVDTCIAVMSSTGYIYAQVLNHESLAVHGTFYLTDVLSVNHDQLKESGGQIGGGGLSVYYSHSLKLLFFSYVNGKNFAASVDSKIENTVTIFPIDYKASNGGSGSARNGSNALYEWSEVVNHSGLVFSFSHSQGCPVVIMVEPDKISLQEIKGLSAKAKIQDLVAVRHAGSSATPKEPGERTTIIVLCEDGSLRIYLASAEHTGYWLQPKLQPSVVLGTTGLGRKKQSPHALQALDKERDGEEITFPVDFFEHCQVFNNNDIEFGGDPLQVYNTAQIKNRLNSTGMYIMDKSIFTVKIINKNPNMVITGLRVLLGSKGALTAPCTLYIHERYISLGPRVTRPRWFDLPLTRAESIAYNSELRLTCGPSEHPEDHIIVDSIKVYGKTKEAFGWPQDEPVAAKNTSSAPSTVGSKQTSKPVATNNGSDADSDISGASQTPAAANISNTGIADEFLQSCLTALNNAFYDKFQESKSDDLRGLAIGGTSDLLTEPLSSRVYHSLKYLMKKLFDTKAECYQFMDEVLLKHAAESLKNESSKTGKLIDEDSFQRCLYHLSMIARRRPFNVTAIKLGDEQDVQLIDLEASTPDEPANKDESSFHVTLLQRIMSAFWRLLGNKPRSKLLVPPCLPGLTRVEMTVKIIIDIIHAVAASVPSAMSTATSIYYQLLSHANSRVSYAAKTALIRLLRVKSDHSRDGVGSVMRSCSKSSDTPPSTRSASPSIDSSHVNTELGLAQSSTLSLGIGRGSRLVQTMRNRPSSHISSQGTAGGTIYDDDGEDDDDDDDDEDDDDDDDDEDDDDNDEDDDDNENYEDLGNDDVAMAIEDQLRHQGEPMEMERSVMQNDRQFFEDMMPGAVPDDAAEEYARMFGHNDGAPPDSGNRENGQGMADSRSLAIDVMRAMAAEAENGVNMGEPNDLENMLMRIDFPNLLPPDVDDDEAMVEYAIALSLQQQGAIGSMNNNPPDRHGASAGERRHSLSEDGSSSASDAGDHVPDSVQDAEAGSQDAAPQSEDQDHHQEECLEVDKEETSSCRGGESLIGAGRLTEIRISLLWDLFDRIDEVKKIGGEKSIPYFQVLATLISSLNLSDESHLQLHRKIVAKIVAELNGEMKSQESENSISVCTPSHEVFVVMMRLLSVMMSKSHTSLGKESDAVERGEFPASIHHQTMKILAELGIKEMCFSLLNTLYKEQWKKQADLKKSNQDTDATPTSSAALLKSLPHRHATDMSPFFLSQYVQSYAGMIFEPYLRLITEMALNLAYQVRKTCSAGGSEVSAVFGVEWRQLLSEFMLFAGMPSLVRRRARKLLLYITGSKEKYREERDLHALRFYMEQSSKLCQVNNVVEQPGRPEFNAGLSLTYNDLIELVETLKKSCDIAESRVKNWQKYCIADPSCLPFLLNTSVRAEENVASSTLKLLLCAIAVDNAPNEKGKKLTKSASKASVSSSKAGKEAKSASSSQRGDKHMSQQLSVQILANISDANLLDFFRHFLLEMNSTAIRWSAHALVLNLFRNTDSACQLRLVNTLWQLCSQTPSYGTKAAQFIDLLGYLSMKLGLEQDAAKAFTDATVQVLQRQNRILSNHQNAILYSQLANYVQFDGFYLESNPCLVCNQLETPLSNIKMSSIKSDTRYTTTQQIIKLVGSYAIQKVTIKVTDIKRTKMIRTAVMYYNNKRVPAIVDLKNNPSMWHRAKSITAPQGEPEIRFDLPLPIVATNLMLEFTDFYENVSASIETLQCPRCSASVQANPGICSNCGENVFQCHKCRSINYDEKDPYLCNVCGFSKYAKFDITVTARQCCAVDSIENDEDRKKMVANVVTLLEKADNVYNQLNAHKPQLEALLLQISQISSDTTPNPDPAPVVKKPKNQPVTLNNASSQGAVNTSVSSSIQQLAKKYCIECKALFEELSSIMRTVLASRSEIVEYDRRQQSAVSGVNTDTRARHVTSSSGAWSQSAPDCYGCASASAQQCVTLLRVLATNEHAKPLLVAKGIIRELIMYNLRRGNVKSRKQVHSLISQLITNNREASLQLNELLLSRITGAINHHGDDLPPSAVACEMQLLTSMINVRDDLWQLRLRAVMQLFQMSVKIKSPAVVENITLPCVHMLRKLVAPEGREDPQPRSSEPNISVEAAQWMSGLSAHSFDSWAKRKGKAPAPTKEKQQADKSKKEIHELYLQEKYAAKWKKFVLNKKKLAPQKIQLSRHSFLRTMLFCQTSSSMRQAACDVITSLAKNTSRKPQVLDLLTSYLDQLGTAGEAAAEFLALYQEQIRPKQWRVYLASRGLLPLLGSLIQMEIAKLAALEEKTLNLHLQQGYALKELTELLSEMVQVYYVRQHYKGKLVGTVLNSYLSLRRLVIQRTNLVDDAQDILLELLEELTTGTESETRSFMAVCIEAIKKQETSDLKTPQFIFERLANIIYPEESDTSEFFLSLDKDPLQEDFLQGRMVGNPYSSNEAGLGPLMRDVKNKICRDCDLIALLEDDSGMELLINNKIIALDLPVRDVYKKIWLPNHTEDDAMHVVYRMRGLLGEATEDIVERLDSDKADQNDEEVYKLASVLSECGGLEVMLMRLESVKSLLHGRQLVEVILKLLSHAIKLKVNRRYLARPQLNTLNILLGSLNLGLQAGEDGVLMVEQLLKIMGSILQEAAADKTNQDVDAEYLTGDKEKLTLLLQQIDSEFVQGHTSILQGILRIIPFLSFGDPDLMQMLIDHFISTLDFEKYDCSHSDDEKVYLNCFCEIVSGIHFNTSGSQLKDLMVKNQILQNATSYLNAHIPNHKNFESEDWKAFKSRPGVPFCLRMLTGLCSKHTTAQELVGDVAIPALHRLEQISSEEGIGPHAENVLEALQEHPEVAKRIKEVRRQTRDEKKKKAMAIRQKQLGSLGMKTNDKGQQVVTKSAILQQISDLVEETGLTCIICREGYKFEPKKVLGIYTYTRRCPLEEFEQKSRKTQGYSTVSHFNVVHYECHTSAVRMARGREEWDSALLQNTNTKCNGLLPLWGAQVPEAAFASCLARHNTYIQEATGQREPGFYSTVHDLKLLLLRFANERSFSEETGGGGRQSNINLIPYLIHTGLYVVNSTRNQGREERTVSDFLAAPLEKWVESSYEVDGPLYVTCVVPFIHGSKKWNEIKIKFLKRLLVTAQARNNSQNSISKLTDREVKEFRVYKPYVMFWALVHLIITVQFKHVPAEGGCAVLANYIRNNDTQLRETGENTLTMFQDDLVVCESFDEFVDVMQLHSDIGGDATSFIKETLDSLPA